MSAELAQLVTALAEDGLQVNLWPTDKGYQANVKERAAKGWTIASDPEPVAALLKALRMRGARIPDRPVVSAAEAEPPTEEKFAPERQPVDADGFCLICEAGGCDACRPSAAASDCQHGIPGNLHCGACEEMETMAEFGL